MLKEILNSLIKFTCKEYSIKNLSNKEVNDILHHIKKVHFLIHYFLYVSLYLINLVSLIKYLRFFNNISEKNKLKIFQSIKKINFKYINKLFEFIYALVILHKDLFEEEKTLKIAKKNLYKKKYIENLVIGSGPGGSITALELLKNKKDVMIVEKGNYIENFKLKHPGREFINMWENGGISAALGNSQIKYASGSCFGGGSEINSGLYHSPDKIFITKLKKKFGVKNLSIEQLNKNLKYLTRKISLNKKLNKNDQLSKYISNKIRNKNFKSEVIPRLVSKRFFKSSMTKTLLKEYLHLGGNVLLNTKIDKILKKNKGWSVQFKSKKEITYIDCKNIFLCLGSINTLSLLIKSNLIKYNQIKDFHFHPMIKTIGKFNKIINSKNFDISPIQITNFFPKFILGNAASSRAQLKINTFNKISLNKIIDRDWKKMAIFHATFSIGSGKIFNLSDEKDPVVKYKISKKDLNLLNEGLNRLNSFLFSIGCEYIYPINSKNEIIYRKKFKTQKILNSKDFNLSSVHVLGGCPFGENKKKTIADSYGRLHNKSGIYINDSSLICENLVKNPQGIIMAIALRNIKNFINENNYG